MQMLYYYWESSINQELYRKYYTDVIIAWGTKAGMLIRRLLHQDQRSKILKHGITFGLCACTRKRLQQLFKQ